MSDLVTSSALVGCVVVATIVFVNYKADGSIVRKISVLALLCYVAYFMTIGDVSLRALADIAKSEGKSFEYIEGLARMKAAMTPAKVQSFVAVLGISFIGLTGRRQKTS
ncbi:hypothetical protein [Marilutibacter spongiae]|uniref:Uncharacterized protein n=1 Tax=Marilutibacter spongiae TaxID=2025720 RepID=A0A7W3Y596_9GAMM|nr:hypothetical protein [Lysobacter spongiae]MBB1059774.1 hypothetical protein [Lysobacter spongiae]